MIDTKEIERVSKLFGIRKISDNEHCGTLSSANCPVYDYGYGVLFLSVQKKDFVIDIDVYDLDSVYYLDTPSYYMLNKE